jgi:hypothetical protein
VPPRGATPPTVVLEVILPVFGLLAFGYGATFTQVRTNMGQPGATPLGGADFYNGRTAIFGTGLATPSGLPQERQGT